MLNTPSKNDDEYLLQTLYYNFFMLFLCKVKCKKGNITLFFIVVVISYNKYDGGGGMVAECKFQVDWVHCSHAIIIIIVILQYQPHRSNI